MNNKCKNKKKKGKVIKYGKYECIEKNKSCAICLDNFKNEDEIIALECFYNHFYHNSCIMEKINKCPICRKEIEEFRNINIIYGE